MDVTRTRALRGPNLWSRNTAIEAVVTCAENERAMAQIAGFEARLRALFPDIGVLRDTGPAGPVSLAHVLEAAALELQAAAGCPVTFSRTAATLEPGTYQLVAEHSDELVRTSWVNQAIGVLIGRGYTPEHAAHQIDLLPTRTEQERRTSAAHVHTGLRTAGRHPT